MISGIQLARLERYAREVECWDERYPERVVEVGNHPACYARVMAQGPGGDLEVLLDTCGDVTALESALLALAGYPTGEEKIITEVWKLGAEFEDDPKQALTCIFEFLGEHEHANYLKQLRGE